MIEFLVDNIYVRFGEQLFQQMVGIPMGTNCAPLLADLFLYFYFYFSSFWINLLRKAKESLLESSIYITVTSMTLSLLIIKDVRNSQFLKPQNQLQLLLISICFSSELIHSPTENMEMVLKMVAKDLSHSYFGATNMKYSRQKRQIRSFLQ